MAKYRIVNLSGEVRTFEGLMVQPRTERTLELKEALSDRSIERYRARQVFIQESSADAENDKSLPPADPKLVEAYARLSAAEGSDREELLSNLGFGSKPAAKPAARRTEG